MIIVPTEKRIDWRRPPVALFSIILINFLAFFLYQSLDQHRYTLAVDTYYEHGLLDTELSSYKSYLAKHNLPKLNSSEFDREIITLQMVSDTGFNEFLKTHGQHTIKPENYTRWQQQRTDVNRLMSKVSAEAFGLKPSFLEPITLISYQFLHGDTLHLFGNMILLLLVGFAAEAALGSLRFTFYYLLSGIGSGLLFSAIELSSGSGMQSLIGASGSLSGVMAIYLVLFRLQKIEFFYWFAIFTGYFRATALVILPIYIAKEIYFYFSNDGSNVAYTAHLGGFITGTILILLTQKLSSTAINIEYLDTTEQTNDPYSVKLDELYKLTGQCEFTKAWAVLIELKKKHGENADLLEIQLNLLTAIKHEKVAPFLLSKLGQSQNNVRIIQAQLYYWKKLSTQEKAAINFDKKYQFACDLISIQKIDSAENIYTHLSQCTNQSTSNIAVLARKISTFHKQRNEPAKAQKYDAQARSLVVSDFKEGML